MSNILFCAVWVLTLFTLHELHCSASDLGALQQLLDDEPNLRTEEGMQEFLYGRDNVLIIRLEQ